MKKDGNRGNLRPVKTKEEAKKRGRNGGIASGKKRREQRTIREMMKEFLSMNIDEPKIAAKMKLAGVKDMTYKMALTMAMARKAVVNSDMQAAKMVLEIIGEMSNDTNINITEKPKFKGFNFLPYTPELDDEKYER